MSRGKIIQLLSLRILRLRRVRLVKPAGLLIMCTKPDYLISTCKKKHFAIPQLQGEKMLNPLSRVSETTGLTCT